MTGPADARALAARVADLCGQDRGLSPHLAVPAAELAAAVPALCDALAAAVRRADLCAETAADRLRRITAALRMLDRHPPATLTPGNAAVLYTSLRLVLQSGRDPEPVDVGGEAA